VPWSLRSRRLDTGVRIARGWTAQRPQSAAAWTARAVIERFRGDFGAAEASLERALELAPADPTLLRLQRGWAIGRQP
jgi:Flp pilus assembly protein TadD